MSANITQYIPAGNEVVILRNGNYEWYTTRKDVELAYYATATCPLRPNLTVLSAETQGYRIWFLEGQLRVRMPEETETKIRAMKLVKIEYDVPTVVSTHPGQYPDELGNSFRHPSQWMWRYGVRTSKSVWIVPAEKVPYREIRRLHRCGCVADETPISVESAAIHYGKSIVALKNALIKADRSYETNLNSARERYQERGNSRESMQRLRNDEARVEKEREKAIKNVEDGAKALGIPMEWVRAEEVTVGISATARTVHSLTVQRAEAVVNATDRLRETGHTAVADAIENGTMPKDIAADYLEDNDDNTFSLRDLFKDE